MRLVIFLILLLAATSRGLSVERSDPDFVTASLLVASPGKALYQCTGHAALRMECTAYGLDHVFSFETNVDVWKFISGKSKGRMAAIPTGEYLAQFREEGRGVTAYKLNLTPEQKQMLWREMDQSIETGESEFNIRHRSCLQEILRGIEASGIPLYIGSEDLYALSSGAFVDALVGEKSPWANMAIAALLGWEIWQHDPAMSRIYPLAFQSHWRHAYIGGRPLIDGEPRTLMGVERPDRAARFTPLLAAMLVFLIALLPWKWVDWTIFGMTTLVGVALVIIPLTSGMGAPVGPFEILFNPLYPLILRYRRARRIYCILIWLGPLSMIPVFGLDIIPMVIIAAALAYRLYRLK